MAAARLSPLGPIQASQWVNTPGPLALDQMHDRVVAVHAFQMLCPGCVAHSIPQALAMSRLYATDVVTVIGLHSVFEHHDAMHPPALQAFAHQYGLKFPIAVDRPLAGQAVPATMRAWGLHGTPSLVLFDKLGQVRLNQFGMVNDLELGTLIGQLISEPGGP